MPVEIERKFLIDPSGIDFDSLDYKVIRQGYLFSEDKGLTRVRIIGDDAFITIKTKKNGPSCYEFEYKIPDEDALVLLNELGEGEIHKTRYYLRDNWHTWEIDIFHGKNEGLILAEVELPFEGDAVQLPDWVLEEVTNDPRYFNSNLVE